MNHSDTGMPCESVHRTCNLCKSESITPVFAIDALRFYNSPNRKRDTYTIARCDSCSLVFVLEIPTEEELRDVYSEGYYRGRDAVGYKNYGRNERLNRIKWHLMRIPGRLGRFLRNPSKLIDVATRTPQSQWPKSGVEYIESITTDRTLLDAGCATGTFLLSAKKAGWNTTGLELSEYSSQLARDNGLNVITGSISSALAAHQISEESFDVVTLWDTFEHLTDPAKALDEVHAVVRKGGFVVIQTLNIDGDRAKVEGNSWHFYRPPKHLFYYGERTLKQYLVNAGFSIFMDDDFSNDVVRIVGRRNQ